MIYPYLWCHLSLLGGFGSIIRSYETNVNIRLYSNKIVLYWTVIQEHRAISKLITHLKNPTSLKGLGWTFHIAWIIIEAPTIKCDKYKAPGTSQTPTIYLRVPIGLFSSIALPYLRIIIGSFGLIVLSSSKIIIGSLIWTEFWILGRFLIWELFLEFGLSFKMKTDFYLGIIFRFWTDFQDLDWFSESVQITKNK